MPPEAIRVAPTSCDSAARSCQSAINAWSISSIRSLICTIRAAAVGSTVPVRASAGSPARTAGTASGALPLAGGCPASGPAGPPFCSTTSVIIGYLSRCGARCPEPGTKKPRTPGARGFSQVCRSGATYGSRTPGAVVKVVTRSDHAVEYAHAGGRRARIPAQKGGAAVYARRRHGGPATRTARSGSVRLAA
ncbi:hypothetical protein GCM10009848_07150 [Micromonospora lupini]